MILHHVSSKTHSTEKSVHQGMDEEPNKRDFLCQSIGQTSLVAGQSSKLRDQCGGAGIQDGDCPRKAGPHGERESALKT